MTVVMFLGCDAVYLDSQYEHGAEYPYFHSIVLRYGLYTLRENEYSTSAEEA